MATGYAAVVTCGDCGGELVHEQTAVTTPTEGTALASCAACGHQWLVHVRLLRVPNPASERRARYRELERERRQEDVMA